MKATVFHDIRKNDKIFLCISSPDPVRMDGSIDMQAAGECAKLKYLVEREIDPQNCTAESIKALVAEMEKESGLDLELSQILKSELGL